MPRERLSTTSSGRVAPPYFHEVRERARRKWDLLGSDPEIAAPWHQLFKQVQSPRHVLSELLQNADDAGATSASARITDGTFVFEHDGEDFTAEQLGSMCRFGFSNKRNLHTIGFRGIGFKSTFSLGRVVHVATPTLSFHFDASRFTEPVWNPDEPPAELTSVYVAIQDRDRQAEIATNLHEWLSSPVSLLFFRNIRRLTIDGKAIERTSLGPGPVPGSERIRLSGSQTSTVLLVRSEPEPFPAVAVDEIRRERSVADAEFDLPPCSVELVVGLEGEQRLYVILPTHVWTGLPFSCNAPFVQDPARTQIKSPATSPTNQWLLTRLGRLAASTFLGCLRNSDQPLSERARAYTMVPTGKPADHALGGVCATAIDEAFSVSVARKPFLLATDGELVHSDNCIAPPIELAEVWTPPQLCDLVDRQGAAVLAGEVDRHARARLADRHWLTQIDHPAIVELLAKSVRVPRPSSLGALARLWHYVQLHIQHDWNHERKRALHVVPVEGEAVLARHDRVVRVSTTRGKLSDGDIKFLLGRLRALDPAWPRFIGADSEDAKSARPDPELASARDLLKILGLDRPTPPESMALRAYNLTVQSQSVTIASAVRLTHILALTDAQVPEKFCFVTRDGHLRPIADGLSADLDGQLEDLIPQDFAAAHLLHPQYATAASAALERAWTTWAATPKSGLIPFVGIVETKQSVFTRDKLNSFLGTRGGIAPSSFHFKGTTFTITDYDFAPAIVERWTKLPRPPWIQATRLIARRCEHYAGAVGVATVRQVSAQSTTRPVECGRPRAAWIDRLQGVECLADTNGTPRHPADLLLRTGATEALLGVEPFVEAVLDRDDASKAFLRVLGVRDTPTGLDKLIDRLRALSRATSFNQVVADASKWCNRIDQLLPQAKPLEFVAAKRAFETERLVPTDQNLWTTTPEVYLVPDTDGFTGLPLVHANVRDLSMWSRLGVETRPSIELALKWLRGLRVGKQLTPDEVRRLEAVLPRAPAKVWSELGHWMTLERTWAATTGLKYRLTMQGLVKWKDLFSGVKGVTADLQFLPADVCAAVPFSDLADLRTVLHYRIRELPGGTSHPTPAPWASALAGSLRRVRLASEEETVRVRAVAKRLQRTGWYSVRDVRVEPCIGGTPVGEPVGRGALWDEECMYVRSGSAGRIYRDVVEELSQPFKVPQVTAAIQACFERDLKWIAEYVESEFDLTAEAVDAPTPPGPAPAPRAAPPQADGAPPPPSDEPVPVAETIHIPPPAVATEPAVPPQVEHSREAAPEIAKPKVKRDAPSVMEQFAMGKGFHWRETVQRHVHADGSWIGKAEAPFRWQRVSPSGQTMRRYWDTPHCLVTDGLDIGADLWELLREFPRECAVVAVDPDGMPCELTGEDLFRMQVNGKLVIAVSRYSVRPSDTD